LSNQRTPVLEKEMGKAATTQALSYPLRLPDEVQADALRLLDVARTMINVTVTELWDRLDEFGTRTNTYAYKQVEKMIEPKASHGHRLWRCEAEQAGRMLRGQAERKKQFVLILPLLDQGMIQPKTETRRAGKKRKAIKQALADLREANSDGGSAVELQSLIEQACNFYLQNGSFPDTYEEMQRVPLLKTGILPYAGDDGAQMGQTSRLSFDLDQKTLTLALRTPDEQGTWARNWREKIIQMPLPDLVVTRAHAGKPLAPSLREIVEADGTRYAVLDFIVEVTVAPGATFEEMHTVIGFDWGIRVLVTVEKQCNRFPVGDSRRKPSEDALPVLRREISRCWRKYEARNNDLGHLAANILLMLAT
jgi:hypothetical protein